MEEAATQTLGCAVLLAGLFLPPAAAASMVYFGWEKRGWLALLSGVIFLVASQVSAAPYLVGVENLFPSYHYETADGGFQGYECTKSTACTWRELILNFADYRRARGDREVELYRTFRQQPWRFWRWWEYATAPRWQLRYQPARYLSGEVETGCVSEPPVHRRPPTETLEELSRQVEELAAWVPEFSLGSGQ
jgi:hypothetical protein